MQLGHRLSQEHTETLITWLPDSSVMLNSISVTSTGRYRRLQILQTQYKALPKLKAYLLFSKIKITTANTEIQVTASVFQSHVSQPVRQLLPKQVSSTGQLAARK